MLQMCHLCEVNGAQFDYTSGTVDNAPSSTDDESESTMSDGSG